MLAFLTGSLLTPAAIRQVSTDNTLTPEEKAAGWISCSTANLNGWMTSNRQPSKMPVEGEPSTRTGAADT